MSAAPLESYPQPEGRGETGKLLLLVNKYKKNNNNNAAPCAAPALSFAAGCELSHAERGHLANLLQFHPDGQAVADELAGQIRMRGRGPGGIRNPRALAARLAQDATVRGVGLWYYWQDEERLRTAQALPALTEPLAAAPASPEVIEQARSEARLIMARHAASKLARRGEK